MGLVSSVVNTIKTGYNKADVALGGRLPGGQTPQTSKAQQNPTPTQQYSQPAGPQRPNDLAPKVPDSVKQSNASVTYGSSGSSGSSGKTNYYWGEVLPDGTVRDLGSQPEGTQPPQTQSGEFLSSNNMSTPGQPVTPPSGNIKPPRSGGGSSSRTGTVADLGLNVPPTNLPFIPPSGPTSSSGSGLKPGKADNYAMMPDSPGGALTSEYQVPTSVMLGAMWGNTKSFFNRIINPSSDPRSLGQAWNDIFVPLSWPGLSQTPNINPTWRGTVMEGDSVPTGYRSTEGMTPGQIKINQDLTFGVPLDYIGEPTQVTVQRVYQSTADKVNAANAERGYNPTQEEFERDVISQAQPQINAIISSKSYGSDAVSMIESGRASTALFAKIGVETAIFSLAGEIPALARSAQLANLEKQGYKAVAVETAFSSREVSQGFTPGYRVFATRQTESVVEKVTFDLKTIPTAEGRSGFGLSSGSRTIEIDNLVFPGSRTLKQDFQITGSSESLGTQSFNILQEGNWISSGEASGSISRGTVFSEGKQKSFTSVGAAQKQTEEVFSFVSSKSTTARARLPNDLSDVNLMQPRAWIEENVISSYRGKIGTQGIIIRNPAVSEYKSQISKADDVVEFFKSSKGSGPKQPWTQGEVNDMISSLQSVKTTVQVDTTQSASAVGGVLESLQTPVASRSISQGAWTGTGMYELTDSAPRYESATNIKAMQMSFPTFADITLEDSSNKFPTPSVIDLVTPRSGSRQNVVPSFDEIPVQGLKNPQATAFGNPIIPGMNVPMTPWGGEPGIILPLLPGLKGFDGGTEGFGQVPSGRQRFKYTPDFEALVFGIKGKAPPGGEAPSPFAERPITKGFSFAFKEGPSFGDMFNSLPAFPGMKRRRK